MKWQFGVLLLLWLGLAAVLVKSETKIETDENGNEYEVKRFTIQSRNLEDGRSQCVVSRRRRAAVGPEHAVAAAKEAARDDFADYVSSSLADDEGDVDDGADGNGARAQDDNESAHDDDDNDESDEDAVDDDDNYHYDIDVDHQRAGGVEDNVAAAAGVAALGSLIEKQNMNGDVDDYTDNGTTGTAGSDYDSAAPAVAVSAAAVAVDSGEAIQKPVAAAVAASASDANGVVVVHGSSGKPVNPNTHAVFQLVPVGEDATVQNPAAMGVLVDNGDELHYEEDISPVSTTAIWSTGDDGPLIIHHYKDEDSEDEDDVLALPGQRPVKGGNKKKNKKKKPIRRYGSMDRNKLRNKRRFNRNRNGLQGHSYRRRQPSANKRKRGGSNNSIRSGNKRRNTKKRVSSSANQKNKKKSTKRRKSSAGKRKTNKRRPTNSGTRRRNPSGINSNRRINSDLLGNYDHKKRRNRFKVDKGSNTYTKTETVTQTGTGDGEGDINCIYINKDTPTTTTTTTTTSTTTTPRPWGLGLLRGRDASGGAGSSFGQRNRQQVAAASGDYGHRKRVNMRFTPPKSRSQVVPL